METTARFKNNHLTNLIQSPNRYDFFQAIRIVYLSVYNQNRSGLVGKSVLDSITESIPESMAQSIQSLRASVSFKSLPALDFPVSPLNEIQHLKNKKNTDQFIIEQSIMALAGQSGVLPDHVTELILQRLDQKDSSLSDFLDLFNNHLIHLFVNTWRKSHFYVNYELNSEQIQHDTTLSLLLAITGQNQFALKQQQIPVESLIYYSGLLSKNIRSAEGLQLILQDYFNLPITIASFVGKWIDVEQSQQTKVGKVRHYNQLGVDTMIGKRIWHVQNYFEIIIGPLNYSSYERLLPNGDMLKALDSFAKFYCGLELQFSIRLLLHYNQVPLPQLRNKTALRLGWNSWLKREDIPRRANTKREKKSRPNTNTKIVNVLFNVTNRQ